MIKFQSTFKKPKVNCHHIHFKCTLDILVNIQEIRCAMLPPPSFTITHLSFLLIPLSPHASSSHASEQVSPPSPSLSHPFLRPFLSLCVHSKRQALV
ncbi:hypothetical protein ANANG_G00009860 [Anguilla anguilla]|uniref:Uncharacterized protein n=1 Tax=Anguilla anguilla TaxID=7936 RepID=A0A9D3S6C8_ANGAN|nr:hypothetical protein ANANG_G00009860 [Anguilla anguilla]